MDIKEFNLKEEYFNNYSYDDIKDNLTNTISRKFFLDYLNYLISKNTPFNLFSFDIDNLKLFNNDNDYTKGDLLINKLIDIISKKLPDLSVIGRLDGDEISVILKGELSYDEKWSLLRLIHQETRKPINILGTDYLVTLTSGLVSYPENASDSATILKLLDKAIYRGKSKGGNCYIIYSNTRHKDLTLKPEITMIEKINRIKSLSNKDMKNLLDNALVLIKELINVDGSIFFSDNKINHANNLIMNMENINLDYIHEEYGNKIIRVNSVTELEDDYLVNFLKTYNIKSCLIINTKLKKNNGLLMVYSKHNKVWNENDIVLLQYLSDYLSFHL